MIKRMQAEGFVSLDGTAINLTDDGLRLAEQVVRRHRLAERLLTDILGLSWADAHLEAGKWEHVISEPVERAINRLLDNPTTCPHGNPIPGSSYSAPDLVTLSTVDVGGSFTVTRIPEELEFTPGLLDYLEEGAVQPARSGTVTAVSPDGTLTVEIDGRHVGIGAFAANRILVTTPERAGAPAQA
jgi:DtxR family Mn-dependent transcriptional regulator